MAAEKLRTFSKDTELVKERRKYIADQAVKLFLKKGYLKTSIREIATACDMSIGTLYHYIGTRDDILRLTSDFALLDFKNITRKFDNDYKDLAPPEKLKKYIAEYIHMIDENQDVVVFWYQETKNLEPEDRKKLFDITDFAVKIAEEILVEGCHRGDFKISDTALLATDIVILGDMWAFLRWFLRKKYTLEDYISEQIDFIMNSVGCSNK